MEKVLPFIPYVAIGIPLTILVALVSFLASVVIGALLGVSFETGTQKTKWTIGIYLTIFRSLPELLTLLLLYYGATAALGSLGLGSWTVSPFAAAAVALGVQFGAYATQVFRDAYRAVPTGLVDAAVAVGMTRRQTRSRVLVPLMFRFALPALVNLFMNLLKVTSLTSVIGVEEVTRRSYMVSGTTHQPMWVYALSAAFFLLIAAAIIPVQRWSERQVARDAP